MNNPHKNNLSSEDEILDNTNNELLKIKNQTTTILKSNNNGNGNGNDSDDEGDDIAEGD